MPRMNRVTKNNTSVMCTNGRGMVILHRTPVVEWTKDEITLNSGGYETYTTKCRMNQAANEFGLNYQVYQRAFTWFVLRPDGREVEFTDGMSFARV